MSSKLRKAIGAVKDHTSISIAKVTNNDASNLEIFILKATTHDEVPIDERHISDIISLISSNKIYARACALLIGKRISRTRNWIVALKSLILVLRIFQDENPYFPKEIFHAMKRGVKILNLSSFRDDSNRSPWDYTAFVRTFALYLDERLDCYLSGKLQRRYSNQEKEKTHQRGKTAISDMKPPMLLDKITHWQLLLDRVIATRPTGTSKTNKLVKLSLYMVVQESFDLYKDISDGLALLLDSFFHLQYKSCVNAFQACVKATKQYEELCSFYDLCKSIGVGRTSEYPSVQRISEELVETLQEFLKDQSSFQSNGKQLTTSHQSLFSAPQTNDNVVVVSSSGDSFGQASELPSRYSDFNSYCNSIEDLTSITTGTSPSRSCYSEPCDKLSQQDLFETISTPTSPGLLGSNFTLEAMMFDDWITKENNGENKSIQGENDSTILDSTIQLELDINKTTPNVITNGSYQQDLSRNTSFNQGGMMLSDRPYNPFLEDVADGVDNNLAIVPMSSNQQDGFPGNDLFYVTPTFQADMQTFATNSNQTLTFPIEDDLFGPSNIESSNDSLSLDQPNVLLEQQLWLQNQNKIISKHAN